MKKHIHEVDYMSGKQTKEVLQFLEQRNHEGKTALYTAVEQNKEEFVSYLMDFYP